MRKGSYLGGPESRNRVYADTSVFGGIVDREFTKASVRFFDWVRAGKLNLAISTLVTDELRGAPEEVWSLFQEMTSISDKIGVTPEAIALREAYLKARIVSPKWKIDAFHVALASVANCAIIISWNFKHIVNYRRIPLYAAVNMIEGYQPIAIHSPLEVIADE
jgi:hypothetical protein